MLTVGVSLTVVTAVSAIWASNHPSARWATWLTVISFCAAIALINTHIPH